MTTSMRLSIERSGTSAPVREFREIHFDLGGPVVEDRLWFYGAYNHFEIDRVISGQPEEIATDVGLFHQITGKLNWKISEKDQLIGFSHWSQKKKPYRELSSTRPAESVLGSEQLVLAPQSRMAEGLVRSAVQ